MTIKDIAALSGYGVGTVSRVLNNHPDVSDKARKIIQETIDKYNFQPNANARSLKSTKQTPIVMITKGSQNMLFADILEKMQVQFAQHNENTEVAYIDEDANEVLYATQLCQEQNPKGIVFLGGNLDYFASDFEQIEVPCVLVTNDASELRFDNLSSFTTPDEEASAKMIDYLIQKGHKKIGVLGGAKLDQNQNETITISLRRLHGCLNAFKRNQIPFDLEKQYQPCRYSMQDGYENVKALLEKDPEITAVFAMGDLIAIGAVRALIDLGKKVPEDIAIAGYDDILLSKFSIPRLATIHQDTEKLAQKTVDALLQRITYDYPPVYKKVSYTLVERESV